LHCSTGWPVAPARGRKVGTTKSAILPNRKASFQVTESAAENNRLSRGRGKPAFAEVPAGKGENVG